MTAAQKIAAVRKALGINPDAPAQDIVAALEVVLDELDVAVNPETEMLMLSRTDPKEYHRRLAVRARVAR